MDISSTKARELIKNSQSTKNILDEESKMARQIAKLSSAIKKR